MGVRIVAQPSPRRKLPPEAIGGQPQRRGPHTVEQGEEHGDGGGLKGERQCTKPESLPFRVLRRFAWIVPGEEASPLQQIKDQRRPEDQHEDQEDHDFRGIPRHRRLRDRCGGWFGRDGVVHGLAHLERGNSYLSGRALARFRCGGTWSTEYRVPSTEYPVLRTHDARFGTRYSPLRPIARFP